jgi:hypothetical protein
MTGTVVIEVRGIRVGRRRYKKGCFALTSAVKDMLGRVSSQHAVITIIPDVTPEIEKKHCEQLQAHALLRGW